MSSNRIPRVGIGGPVGSGKTMLIEQIVPILSKKGYNAGIISNDVVSKEDLTVEGILGKFQVVGTVYIITRELYVKRLKHEIIEKINEYEDNISGGVSILPTRQGIVVRILGNTAGDVKSLIFEVVRITRNQILGVSFSGVRKT